jgi:hypothetical protein
MLFFEHDATNACCRLESTEKGIRATGLAPSFEEAWG